MMADAARYNVDRGAQIIDINMGCPAKKVCNKWAGSALMQDEAAGAGHRAQAVVQACAPLNVPVTLKMRTGWCAAHRNALALARAAEAPACRCSPCTAARASRATRARPNTTPWPP
jgi:tRNA-dihydrouridine synthase B